MTFALIILSFSLSVLAITPESRSFDFNKDQRPDYIERYRGKTLVETLYDSDSDGTFDRHTILDPESEVFKIVDLYKTKKNPRKRTYYWNHELRKKTVAHVQIDHNNDGVWDLTYDTSTDIDQKAETCASHGSNPGTDALTKSVLDACLRAEDYTVTDFGYKIHKSCLEGRPWFINEARKSLTDGMACLSNLVQQGMRGAARNLSSLESILLTTEVQIICNESSYDWNRAAAHATTGAENPGRNLPLVHPGISLGPEMLGTTRTEEQDRQFRSTLFHEQLHNLGHRHGTDPEVSYTCSTCCFPSSYTNANDKALACKVCGGDYSSITDPDYLEDITNYAEANYGKDEALSATLAFLRENQNERLGLAYLALNSAGVFNPVGSELAYILLERRNLDPREAAIVARANPYGFNDSLNPYRSGGRVIAQAYLKLYEEKNPAEALRFIRANAPLLKQQFALRTGKNSEYMANSLKDSVDALLAEVWYRGYRGQASAVTINGQAGDALTTEGLDIKDLLGI